MNAIQDILDDSERGSSMSDYLVSWKGSDLNEEWSSQIVVPNCKSTLEAADRVATSHGLDQQVTYFNVILMD